MLASEITDRLLHSIDRADPEISEACWNGVENRDSYETVLEYFQRLYRADSARQERSLRYIEDKIRKCFIEMDGLYEGKSADLSDHATYNPDVFLAHFDAIFTTNQDTLIEKLFANLFVPLSFSRTDRQHRSGLELPGVVRSQQADRTRSVSDVAFDFSSLKRGTLPYIKLHGSHNWQTAVGRRLMISGGSKDQQIAESPLLKSYLGYFFAVLMKPDTKLVIIGYGFGDMHLNSAIARASQGGATIALIDLLGSDVTRGKYFNADGPLDEMPRQDMFAALRGSLSVLTKRTLKEVFGDINQAKQLFRDALNVEAR